MIQKTLIPFLLALTLSACTQNANLDNKQDLNKRYLETVRDAAFIDDEELMPLISLDPNFKQITYNQDGQVLLMFFHNYPQSYPQGKSFAIEHECWCVSDLELLKWCKNQQGKILDPTLRFKQLVGVKPQGEYNFVSAIWVDPHDVIRPATDTNVFTTHVPKDLDPSESAEYKEWFKNNIIYSYFEDAYPWTRIGYTYDWAFDSREYGLSEFLLKKGVQIKVERTLSVTDFAQEQNLLKL